MESIQKKCLILFLALLLPTLVLAKTKSEPKPATVDADQSVSAGFSTASANTVAASFLTETDLAASLSSANPATRADLEYFRLALLKYYLGEYNSALSALQKIHPDFALQRYAIYLSVRIYLDQNLPDKALLILSAKDHSTGQIGAELEWVKLEALARNKNLSEMLILGSQLEKKWRGDEWNLARVHEVMTLGYLIRGDRNGAAPHIKSVLVDLAGTPSDSRLLATLEKFGLRPSTLLPPQLMLKRAERLIEIGAPDQALVIYQRLHGKDSGESTKFLSEKIAFATFKMRDYSKAATLYAALLRTGQYSSNKTEILEKLAQASARHDDFATALATNKSIISQFPGTSAAGIADFKLGFLYYDAGQYREALRHFEKYVATGTAKQKQRARWYRLWSYYWLKDFTRARSELQSLLTATTDKNERRGLMYWQARVEEKLGNTAAAKSLYQSLTADDYYGMLAKQRLRMKKLDSVMLVSPSFLDAPDSSGKQVTLSHLSPQTPQWLYTLGLDRFAYDQSTQSPVGTGIEALQLQQLAGNFVSGYIATRAGKTTVAGADRLVSLRFAYPQAFAKYISVYAKHFGVPASLAYSIMRQESTFKPDVRSPAFALGLMQIIPPTARQIATELGFVDFDQGMLAEPRINTLFGTSYLGSLLQRFDSNRVYAIAAYNAGPDAVTRWSKKALHWEADEFIESIPYNETRDYVKRVLINHWMYEKIY